MTSRTIISNDGIIGLRNHGSISRGRWFGKKEIEGLENFDFSINLRIKVADGHVRFTQTFVSFVNLSCIADSFASV